MSKDKFLTVRDKKIKSAKEKADALYNNLSHKDLSDRDSLEYLSKRMFKYIIKYTPYPNTEYSKELCDQLTETFLRKILGDKDYEEQFAIIKEAEVVVTDTKQLPDDDNLGRDDQDNKPQIIPNSVQPMVKGKPIPYASGLTREFVEKHRHLVRPCDPNEIIKKKEKQSNGFVYAKFEGY